MKKFILGYANPTDSELTEYNSTTEAFDAEEWVYVEAETLAEAKEKYEETFQKWKSQFDL